MEILIYSARIIYQGANQSRYIESFEASRDHWIKKQKFSRGFNPPKLGKLLTFKVLNHELYLLWNEKLK